MARSPRRSSSARAFALALALTGLAAPARAEPPQEIVGSVIGLDADDLILDLGAADGLTDGATVELWRPIKIKHPVSGKVLNDRFRLGFLEILQARKNLSLASPSGTLSRPPARGDVILLVRAAPAAPSAPAPAGGAAASGSAAPDAAPAPAPEDAEALEVGALIEQLKGADLATRIRRYEALARAKPKGKYSATLLEEAAALRQLFEPNRAAHPPEPPAPLLGLFHEPTEAVANVPLRLGVELRGGATGAVLHVRDKGTPSYRSFPMTPESKHAWGATLPPERVNEPAIEYFIEATGASGRGLALVGSEESPRVIEVRAKPRPIAPEKLDATVSLATDYADYNRLLGNDRAWQTEGYFGLRLGDTGVRALRSGFGVYRGVGGSVAELDVQHLKGRAVGLTYGYLEAEVGFVRSFSMIGRLAVGLLDDGLAGGGQLLVRIGSDRGTNLMIGGELLGGVGLRSIVQLELATFPRFPILIRSEVTNQPAGSAPLVTTNGVATGAGEVGARGIAQLGWRVVPSFTIAVRGSFQGRTITHAGPGLGGGVTYEW